MTAPEIEKKLNGENRTNIGLKGILQNRKDILEVRENRTNIGLKDIFEDIFYCHIIEKIEPI